MDRSWCRAKLPKVVPAAITVCAPKMMQLGTGPPDPLAVHTEIVVAGRTHRARHLNLG